MIRANEPLVDRQEGSIELIKGNKSYQSESMQRLTIKPLNYRWKWPQIQLFAIKLIILIELM